MKDIGVLAHETRRVLKPDGKILVVDWSRRADNPAAPPKDKRKEAMEVEARFLKEGIVKERDVQVNDTHWGVVFKLA